MTLDARAGQRASALRQYEECERVLRQELGVPPAARTRDAYRAILARREPEGDGTSPSEGGLSPSTAHAERPTTPPSPPTKHNLPAQVTPLVGREAQLAEVVALWRKLDDARGLAWALLFLAWGTLTRNSGTPRAILEESIDLFRQVGDESGLAYALWVYARFAHHARDAQQVRSLCQEGLRWARKAGSLVATSQLLGALGNESYFEGDHQQAEALWEEAIEVSRDKGNRVDVAHGRTKQALISLRYGHWQEARIRLVDSLVVYRETNRRDGIAACVAGYARLAHGTARPERADRLLGVVSALLETPGGYLSPLIMAEYDRTYAAVREQLDEGAWQAAWEAGRAMASGQDAWARAVAYALEEEA